MPQVFESLHDANAFVQARLDTREWWVIPVATPDAAELALDIANRFYTGENKVLFDAVLFFNPMPSVPLLWLALASKSCMSAEQFAEMAELPVTPDHLRDVIVTASTPLSAMLWLNNQFDWPMPIGDPAT